MYYNPYENIENSVRIKTNFHTHAGTGEGTCGRHPIEMVTELYRGLGFNALCISNHDLYTETAEYTNERMFMIPGVEYSNEGHMLTIGVKESFHNLNHQDAVNETLKHGGFTILCHPNWIRREYWPLENMITLQGFAGIEVMNTLIYRLSGSGMAADLWDKLLKKGRLVYGFGNDDFHYPFDAGRCWNEFFAVENNYAGLKQAADSGSFTVSTGPVLQRLTFEKNTINVKVRLPIETYIKDFTYKFINENGVESQVYGEEAEYALKGENYIRIEAVAENGSMLFTQPVYKKEFYA